MPFPHKRCQLAEPEGFYQSCSQMQLSIDHHYLPKKSTCTAATAASNLSSESNYSWSSSSSSTFAQHACPVTGVYANITVNYCISPNVLGKGHFGIVRECIHRATQQTFAVKSIDKSKIRRLDHLQREIYLLASMDHHAIMRMVDCYEDMEYVHIITERCTGGELFDLILDNFSSHGCLHEQKAANIIKSLLEAVAYLHKNDVVHRDIKPENILFETNGDESTLKLIDFGLARVHRKGDAPMTNPVGTAYYMSPELLQGNYTKSTDIWSIGVVAYVLLSGYPPFNGSCDGEIHNATQRGKLYFHGTRWADKGDDAIDFIKCLLRRDQRRRYTAEKALRHPWIQNMMDF
eukprot:CAMPEP_0183769204 /NCGR_PEP_ID=MMETSP0739-20130205/20867_1 /TAXON_ID=385413 /ORGANISM="Thalassiosira miniscula, Strain CCMP1093" /LENGTH=347 /DNA_ID=CAMNT_0026008731 /DNA_START=78 /DNA_END=1121 /DNA_ORIENTATION=-